MKQTKTNNNYIIYMALMTLAVMLMLISPALNKNIYAHTNVNDASAQYADLSGKTDLDATMNENVKSEHLKTIELYNALGSLSTANSQKENYNFSKTNAPNQEKTFGHVDSLNIDVPKDFIKTGKIFDPVGEARLEAGKTNGYSLAELNMDAGVFCIEEGAPLAGVPSGVTPPKYNEIQKEGWKTSIKNSWGDTLGDEVSKIVDEASKALDDANEKLLNGNRDQIINEITNGDPSDTSGARADKLSDNKTKISNKVVEVQSSSDRLEDEVLTILSKEGVEIVRDYYDSYVVKNRGQAEAILNKLREGIKVAEAHGIQMDGALIPINIVKRELGNADAALAFMFSEYEKIVDGLENPTKYIQDKLTNLSAPHYGINSIQHAIWASPWSKQAHKWVPNALNYAGDDFQKYWNKLRGFASKYGVNLPNDQRILYGEGNGVDAIISANFEAKVKDGAKVSIKNPQVNYQPRILPGDGVEMKDAKVVNFDKNSQKWLIGPLKVDYILEGTNNLPEVRNSAMSSGNISNENGIKDYFAGITAVHLKGIYEKPDTKAKKAAKPSASAATKSQYLSLDKETSAANPSLLSRPDIAKRDSEDKFKANFEDAKSSDPSTNVLRKEEQANPNLQDIKGWRLKMNRNSGPKEDKKYGPGMKKKDAQGEDTYGIPAPNEEFFIEIDYDPNLKSIKKIRFEFAYMVFGGEYKEYAIFANSAQVGDAYRKYDAELEEIDYYTKEGGGPSEEEYEPAFGDEYWESLSDQFTYKNNVKGKANKAFADIKYGPYSIERNNLSSIENKIYKVEGDIENLEIQLGNINRAIEEAKKKLDTKKVKELEDQKKTTEKGISDLKNNKKTLEDNKTIIIGKIIGKQKKDANSFQATRTKNETESIVQNKSNPNPKGLNSNGEAVKNPESFDQADDVTPEEGKTEKGYRVKVDGASVAAEASAVTSQQQTVSVPHTGRWPEEVAVELDFETPGGGGSGNKFNLAIPIGGKVWEDKHGNNAKNVGFDHIITTGSKSDVPVKNVKVTIFRDFVKLNPDGSVNSILDRQYARLYDDKGNAKPDYNEIYTDENGSYGNFNVKDVGFTSKELEVIVKDGKKFKDYAITFDVRFDYDGMKYEPVKPLQIEGSALDPLGVKKLFNSRDHDKATAIKKELERSSFAFENKDIRNRYNAVNAKIAGKNAIDGSGKTVGKTIAANENTANYGGLPLNASSDDREIEYNKNGEGTTVNGIKQIASDYVSKHPGDVKTIKQGTNEFTNAFMSASTLDLGLKLPANEKIRLDTTDMKVEAAYKELSGRYYNTRDYMKHINLGLKKRPEAEVAVEKSLNSSMLTVNKKATVRNYKDMDLSVLTDDEKSRGMGNVINLPNKLNSNRFDFGDTQAKLDIYKTDYIYRTDMYSSNKGLKEAIDNELTEEKADDELEKAKGKKYEDIRNPRELDIYLTYTINVANNSFVDVIDVNAIDDYYTDKMELVNKSIEKHIERDPAKSIENSGAGSTAKSVTSGSITVTKPTGDGEKVEKTKISVPLPAYQTKVGEDRFNHGSYKDSLPKLDATVITGSGKFKAEGNTGVSGVTSSRITTQKGKEDILIRPNESAEIFLTFRIKKLDTIQHVIAKNDESVLGEVKEDVDNGDIKKLNNSLELGDFANISELASYTSYDAITKMPSAKIIENIAPDNISSKSLGIINGEGEAEFEVDTDNAMGITVKIADKAEDKIRKLSGILWEDKKNIVNGGVETGDGQYDPANEKGIPGHPVTLEERVSVKASNPAVDKDLVFTKDELTGDKYVDIPFVWPNEINGDTVHLDLEKVTGFKSNILTLDESGKEGKYLFEGVPAGNMVVSLDYTSPKDKASVFKDNIGKASVDAIRTANLEFSDLVPTVRDYDGADVIDRAVKFYNGLDFKNTMFYSDGGNSDEANRGQYFDPMNLDKTWLSKDKSSTPNNSYLRDDEFRRAEIGEALKTMTSSNIAAADIFRGKLGALNDEGDTEEGKAKLKELLNKIHNKTSMRATTPKLNFSIEYYEGIKSLSSRDGKYASILNYSELYALDGIYLNSKTTLADSAPKYDIQFINLGLVERPETKVVMNKEITNINIKSADGNTLVDLKYDISVKPSKEDNIAKTDVKYGGSVVPETKLQFIRKLNEKESIGNSELLELDRTDNSDGYIDYSKELNPIFKAGFKYINIDKTLLQDATLNIKYGIYAYNAGEKDRKIDVNGEVNLRDSAEVLKKRETAYRVGYDVGEGTLTHQSNVPLGNSGTNTGYYFGKYAGLHYYVITKDKDTSKVLEVEEDDVADVVITNIADVPTDNMELNLSDTDNQEWVGADISDIVSLIQNGTNDKTTVVDGSDKKVIKGSSPGNSVDTNFYLVKKFSKNLKPFDFNTYTTTDPIEITDSSSENFVHKWTIKPTAILSAQDTANLVFENTVEVVGYQASNGMRDLSTPGNLRPLLDVAYETGKGVVAGDKDITKVVPEDIVDTLGVQNLADEDRLEWVLTKFGSVYPTDRTMLAATYERDAAASEPVTLSTPTGLSQFIVAKNSALIVTGVLIVASLGTIYVTSLNKRKK